MNNIFSWLSYINDYFGFPRGLLTLIAYQENGRNWNFNPNAVSWRGAKGLMQITSLGAQQIAKLTGFMINPFDITHAIWGAGITLKWLHSQFGSWRAAIAAYNAGYGTVRNNINKYGYFNEAALPAETRNYLFVANYLGL